MMPVSLKLKLYQYMLLLVFGGILIFQNAMADSSKKYIVMQQYLKELKKDFNESSDEVRLLFIISPTWSGCLKGLADLNNVILDGNNDPNLRTLISYVPKLNARESDVPRVTKIVTGGNTSHYWEDSGIIGDLFQHTLDINVYAWDVWMIYKPGAQWHDKYPPAPDFWMHNLWGVEGVPHLESRAFADKVTEFIKKLRDGR